MEVRYDNLKDRHVVFSPERSSRPEELHPGEEREGEDDCPFCRGNEDMTPPTIRKKGDPWRVRLIENKYPALSLDEETRDFSDGLLQSMPGHGRHEILIEGGEHERFDKLDSRTLQDAASLLLERCTELSSRDGIENVLVFKNKGEKAGASLSHPHTQILASPVVPSEIRKELEQQRDYSGQGGGCLLSDLVDLESEGRAVAEGEFFTAYCPHASSWPYEVRIVPERHVNKIGDLEQGEKEELFELVQDIATAYQEKLGRTPYNVLYHGMSGEDFHFHVEMFPRRKDLAGAELSGIRINETLPGDAAEVLRDGLP
ncbi:MAG: galactose-1-phosphate uridylyltransferase [Candidatus Nanohaloarchaea archaeon]|nr:galactose-1-phosphate uridylyltransferase [Candidatus Nanohaloarchaea archaeon]